MCACVYVCALASVLYIGVRVCVFGYMCACAWKCLHVCICVHDFLFKNHLVVSALH